MKATVNTKELTQALNHLTKIVDRKLPQPIARHVLIEALGNRVHLSVTNFSATLCLYLDADVATPGSTTADVRELKKSLRKDKETTLELTTADRLAVGPYRLETFKAEDFPVMPAIPEQKNTPFQDITAFKDAVGRVAHAAANDYSRPVLGCVNVTPTHVVTADGFRLAKVTVETPVQGLFPATHFVHILAPFTRAGFVAGNPTHIFAPNGRAIIRVVEGTFPNYDAIVPKPEMFFKVDAKLLRWHLPKASNGYGSAGNAYDFHFNGSISIFAEDYRSECPTIESQGDIITRINRKYVDECLSFAGDVVTFGLMPDKEFINEKRRTVTREPCPILVTNGDYRAIIMPVRRGDAR